ncbi:MAG: putative UDP-N-acetyl-D-mannosaminuronic acid transferase [archaeon ADurb.Bin336]|nr:MAG: putative UDP-N-acetyl-D-mannosaminuronic acid transferase [archaeon ADurb.Bin336]
MQKRVVKKYQKVVNLKSKKEKLDDSFFLSFWKIFDISLFSSSKVSLLKIIGENLDLGTKKYWIATVNPEFVMAAEKDRYFKQVLQKTSLNVIDGIGLIWARELERRFKIQDSRFLNKTKKFLLSFEVGIDVLKGKYKNQMASGADLILDLTKMAKEKNKKIFLLGGWGDRAKKTAEFLMSKFLISNNQIRWSEGEPGVNSEEVIKQINKFKPDILLVAYGMKRQELWIDKNLTNLDVGLVMGVGRSFDYYSGDLKRAPRVWRKIGMEWLYSLLKEPKRWRRQLALPKFVSKVLKNK